MIIKIVDTASPNIAVTGALVTPGDENTGDVTSWSVQASYDDGATWESTGIGFVAAENGSVYRATLNALAATGTNLFKLVASGEGVIDKILIRQKARDIRRIIPKLFRKRVH